MSQRVSFYVTKYIEGDPTIQLGLQRGLISSRVLTKHIIEEEHEFKGSFDDVRNAVRRYTDQKVPLFDLKNVYMAFKDSFIDVRSRLASVDISRNLPSKKFSEIVDNLALDKEKFSRIFNNEKSYLLMINEENIDKITKIVDKGEINSIRKDITSVTLHLDPSVKNIPGVYFLIMGQISLNKINIYDVVSCKSDLIIYVDQKDGAKVHQILSDLAEYEQRFCNGKG